MVAVVSCYLGVYGLSKLASMGGKKKVAAPAPVVAAAAAVQTGGADSKYGFVPPTLDSFDEWEKNDDNWAKWEAFMSNNTKLEEWCDSIE